MFSKFSFDFMELSNELMCSFVLEFLIKFSLSLLFEIKWSLENFWSSFILVYLHFQ